MEQLMAYDWPGNVRELQNVLQQTLLLSPFMMILPENLPEKFRGKAEWRPLEGAEREQILQMLKNTEWNLSRTAQLLCIDRKTLRAKIVRYGLSRDGGGK